MNSVRSTAMAGVSSSGVRDWARRGGGWDYLDFRDPLVAAARRGLPARAGVRTFARAGLPLAAVRRTTLCVPAELLRDGAAARFAAPFFRRERRRWRSSATRPGISEGIRATGTPAA